MFGIQIILTTNQLKNMVIYLISLQFFSHKIQNFKQFAEVLRETNKKNPDNSKIIGLINYTRMT